MANSWDDISQFDKKEHPLATLAGCAGLIFLGLVAFGVTWFFVEAGLAMLEDGVESTRRTLSGRRVRKGPTPFTMFAIAGTAALVGLVFVIGGAWWTGIALKALKRGEQV